MLLIEWDALEVYHYLLLGGGVVAVLLLMLYLIPGTRRSPGMRAPAIIAGALSGLIVGTGIGIMLMAMLGYQLSRPNRMAGPLGMGKGPDQGMMMAMPGMGRGGKGGMGGMGTSVQTQLANLVAKLDLLTGKPLQLSLTDKERAAVREQLAGLADNDNLEDGEVRRRLDNVLEALKDHRKTLEDAGYRWPAQVDGLFGDGSNPFREEQTAQRLQALQQRLGG